MKGSFFRHLRPLDPSRDREFKAPGRLSPSWRARLSHLQSIPVDSQQLGTFSSDAALNKDYVANAYTAASECHGSTGVFPISFVAFPTPNLPPSEKTSLLSAIVPGTPYNFDRYGDYLRAYQTALLGITHRKAGWDALRHSEIIASGCVPLMPDAEAIPQYSMTFYPKTLMEQVAKTVRHQDARPSHDISQAFETARNQVLNTDFLAEYVLRLSSTEEPNRVLFIDKSLPSVPDYQSLMTLVGLKRRFGQNCAVYAQVPYVYDDCADPTDPLYGRGFGYFRALPSILRSAPESSSERPHLTETLRDTWDVIIIGNIVRNLDVARQIERVAPSTPTVWIDGEDHPPSRRLLRFYSRSRPTVFVREWSRPAAKSSH
jgi:hypothetical protein